VAQFDADGQYVTAVAPIVEDPLVAGTDLSGKKFTIQIRTVASFTALAWIFSNTGPTFDSALSSGAALTTADWASQELDLTQPAAPYDPSDMRFLGVLIQSGMGCVHGSHTFYVDTAVIADAP